MRRKLLWIIGGAFAFFVAFLLFSGLDTMTALYGAMDSSYKMNRLPAKWLNERVSQSLDKGEDHA